VGLSTAYPLYHNFAAFADDEWKLAPKLNLSLGLRWEVNPAPGRLSPRKQEIIRLRVFEGLTPDEIVKRTGYTVATVRH